LVFKKNQTSILTIHSLPAVFLVINVAIMVFAIFTIAFGVLRHLSKTRSTLRRKRQKMPETGFEKKYFLCDSKDG
jgi:hypothetical protein